MRILRSGTIGLGLALGGVTATAQVPPEAAPTTYAAALRARYVPLVNFLARPTAMPDRLNRRVVVHLERVPLQRILVEIATQAQLGLAYGEEVASANRIVSLAIKGTAAEALDAAVRGTEWVTMVTLAGQVVVVRAPAGGVRVAQGSVVGMVTDANTKQGVAAAEVLLGGTSWKALTDTAGRYHLVNVDSGSYMLTVRRLGYAKQVRAVTIRESQVDTVDMILEPVAARLNELVSTATGPRRRLDIANDVTTINADSVMQVAPIRSVTDLLENRVPGLTVLRTSGAPGDPSRLRLRGIGTVLGNDDPIVIVDGIRVYSEQSANRSSNLAQTPVKAGFGKQLDSLPASGYASRTPSPLDYIDPNTIETIEVLKGPSAATLYGQDAANGVIVITTKKGRPGPTRWTASLEQGRTRIAGDYPELYFRWGREVYFNDLVNCPVSNLAGVVPCTGDSVRTFQLLNDPALTVLDRGHRTSGSLTASGGTSSLTYAVTGTYADEVGVLKLPDYEVDRYQSLLAIAPPDWMRRPQNFKQWGVTSRIALQLGHQADLAFTASFSRSEQQKSSLDDQLGGLMTTYLDRSSGVYYSSPSGVADGNTFVVATPIRNYYQRALARATQFTNGIALNYRPRNWLTVTADAGLNLIHRADQLFLPRGLPQATLDTTGQVSDGQGTSVVSTVNLRANALQSLGRGFQFRFAAGANYTGSSTNDVSGGSHQLDPGTSLQGNVIDFLHHSELSDATFGWYLEPSVGNSKFNFSSGLRLDGGKSYGANVSGFQLPKFPKLGFSYLVSDEPWFPLKDLVQSLRVRLSYGRASRQPGPKDKLRLYAAPAQVFADSQFLTGITLASLGNTEVRPERTGEFEGGFDADLFESRVTLSFTGYRKTTDDALLNIPLAPSVYGITSIVKNIGVVRNTGLNLQGGIDLVRSGFLMWHTDASLNWNRNLLVKLAPGVEPFYTSIATVGNVLGAPVVSGIRIAPDYPVNGRWSVPITGYADANGNGVLEMSEVQFGDTTVYVGGTDPSYTAAFSTTVSLWHGAVTINAMFSRVSGLSQQNVVAKQLAPFSSGQQVPGAPLAEQVGTLNYTNTDYTYDQVVSTTRLESLGLRYALPTTVARRLGAEALSVAVQGANLGLWTNYRGVDPNVNAFGTGNNVVDTGVLPQPRTWQVRVNATY